MLEEFCKGKMEMGQAQDKDWGSCEVIVEGGPCVLKCPVVTFGSDNVFD